MSYAPHTYTRDRIAELLAAHAAEVERVRGWPEAAGGYEVRFVTGLGHRDLVAVVGRAEGDGGAEGEQD